MDMETLTPIPEPVPSVIVPVVPAKKKKKGKKGKLSHQITNYVRVSISKTEGIHEYSVKFNPRIDNLEIRKKALHQFNKTLGDSKIFDGILLFLPIALPDKITVLLGNHPCRTSHDGGDLKVTLIHLQRKPHGDLVQLFNVLFRRVMTVLGKFELKRSYFDLNCKYNLPQFKLEVWPGICTRIEDQEDGMMLCLDTSYRVFRTDTVYEYYSALNDNPNWKEDFTKYILGKVVVTGYNNFTYKVDDIDWERSPLSNFDCNGKEMTYAEYYRTQYKLEILDVNQPLLLSRVKVMKGHRITEEIKIVSIVPELCYVAGMNPEHYSSTEVMKELHRYTYVTPAQRMKALKAFVEQLNDIPEAKCVLDSWNVSIDSKLLEVTGREICGPALKFGGRSELREAGAEFTKESSESCYDTVDLKRWLVICSQRDIKIVKKFVECYKQICGRLGIHMPNTGNIVTLKGQNPHDFREALMDYADPESIQFVVVVMPFYRNEIYSVIKKVCLVERPIASQVLLIRSLTNETNLLTTVRNVVMQINCKLGGSLWALRNPVKERVMFVGIDVYHDVKKIQPSIVALIVSMNNTCTKYFSKVHIQKIHQEITDNMKPMLCEALECYREMNGTYPERIIVFRDGGSMSAMKLLIEHEVKPMLSAVESLCPELKHFTYTVVAKRIPQRFFTQDTNGRIVNPNIGTVIDHTITYPGMFDFYVVSQRKSQGTITPTHYMVIHDVGGIEPDLMQKCAYATTFMYFNWAGTIQVPAMIQYAHKLSSLVGQYLKMDPSKTLERTLYYL